MKNRFKQWVVAAVAALALCGCGNFLEQYSQNMAYLENVEDLDELLIGQCYLPRNESVTGTEATTTYNWSNICQFTNGYFLPIHLMDDDVSEYVYTPRPELTWARMKMSQIHYWQRDPWRDSEYKELIDNNFTDTYERIAVLNTILNEVEKFRTSDIQKDSTCNRIEGEALFLRAQNYFWLANLYGRPYCKATAATDVCIPLKTEEMIEDRFFSRSPMEKVYGQMRQDLLDATELFRGVRSLGVYRANRAAAFALLSRVCLYMERYEEAVAYADSVLMTGDYSLLDFNARTNSAASVMYASSPETIFTQGPNVMQALHAPVDKTYRTCSGYTVSADLLGCYEEDDLRLSEFFVSRPAPASGERCIKWREEEEVIGEVSDYMAIRLPEVYLNKAEALALLGRDGEAREALEELRSRRIESETYESVNYSGADLVYFIRDERRRELCFEGHRWFDLRRYAVNTEFPQTKPIEHVSLVYQEDGAPEGIRQGKYVLNPYDQEPSAYLLPVPRTEIEFNEGMLTNEERNERGMVSMND